jgi:hypothetical protein
LAKNRRKFVENSSKIRRKFVENSSKIRRKFVENQPILLTLGSTYRQEERSVQSEELSAGQHDRRPGEAGQQRLELKRCTYVGIPGTISMDTELITGQRNR